MIKKTANFIRRKVKKLQLNMNNRKISTKTFYLYIFCVLVPVLVTNTFIIGNTLKASSDEGRKNMNNIVNSVMHDITSSLENAVFVTVDLYACSSIYKFLDTRYENSGEFFTEYNRVFDNYVFFSSSKHLINNITLFSDNATMISGGRYYRIDAIQKEDWYLKFVQSDAELFIYPYYNNTFYINKKNRMISVIRKLNYIEMSSNEKIVKLDLNYNKICEAINNSAFNTTVYVCHGDKIIFSNDRNDKGIKEDFDDVSKIPMNKIQIHKLCTAYGFDFDIYLAGYKSNYISMLKGNLWLIAVLFLADALIPAVMLTLFSSSITKRILLLGKYMKKVKGEEFVLIPEGEGKDEIGELLDNYNLMATRMKNLIEYEYKSKLEQQELHLARQQAELLALYSQINPHFMFNVLENIRMRSVIKGENETSQMIESLARLMRKSAQWGSDLIPIEQEIGFIRDYLNLQKYRFGDVFNYKFRINTDCSSYLIPSLVLVTFVENSCVHGLNREGHSGAIYVSVNEENSYLHIEIEDTGIGMEEEQVKRLEKSLNEANIDDLQKSSSLGMLNACIRLKKYCGSQTKIIVESEKQVGTCIIIKIPIENVKGKIKL
ncbi:MAG TPA: histidine kinase [Mobilitalea sp.]|nr:histidine kinase [Mobilitalea sp.]